MLLATPFRPTNVQKYLLRVPRTEVILYERESLRWVIEPNVVTIGAQYSATDYTPDLAPPCRHLPTYLCHCFRMNRIDVYLRPPRYPRFKLFFCCPCAYLHAFWLFKTVLHCRKVERELCNFFSWKESPTIIIFNVTFTKSNQASCYAFLKHMFCGTYLKQGKLTYFTMQ